jgi:hypothetical protein
LVTAAASFPRAVSTDCHSKVTPPSSSHSSIKTVHIRSRRPSSIQRCMVRWTVESSGNGSPFGKEAGNWFH